MLKLALGDHRADAQADAVEHEVGILFVARADADVRDGPALLFQMRDDRFLEGEARKVRADQNLLVLDRFHGAASLFQIEN